MGKTPIRWRKVIAEGLAIVASILLAFAIQAWWETARERSEEDRALLALARDFRDNRDTLQILVADHRHWAESLRHFYGSPLEDLLRLDPDSILNEVMSSLHLQITYDPSVGGLETLLSGGRINTLQSSDLESALWRWRRQLEDSREEGQLLIETVNSTVHETTRLGLTDPRIPPPADTAEAREALAALWNSDFLAAQTAILDVWRGSYITELESLLALTDSVILLLPEDP